MANRRWLLPEAIEDVLPREALRIEAMRRAVLDEFIAHGYELVIPPLLEYIESLVSERGQDLDLRTFKLVDQLSGRGMGVRADITPQVARIDAHLCSIARASPGFAIAGVSCIRFLPALTQPASRCRSARRFMAMPDLRPISKVSVCWPPTLDLCEVAVSRIDLGHVAVFRALTRQAGLGSSAEKELFDALQGKDVPAVRELVAGIAEPVRTALQTLPELYGDRGVLDRAAKVLPNLPEIETALSDLRRMADALGDLPLSFDLADLRGYHYHSGIAFAAYCSGSPAAVALGGRYDDFGRAFGRGRPATGFSMDLRALVRLAPNGGSPGAIAAPWPEDDTLHAEAQRLRALGERVILALPGHEGSWREAGCDRILVRQGNRWIN
jgi:ATP phosphoribosyltransferase regulatory subunit